MTDSEVFAAIVNRTEVWDNTRISVGTGTIASDCGCHDGCVLVEFPQASGATYWIHCKPADLEPA